VLTQVEASVLDDPFFRLEPSLLRILDEARL